VTGLPNGTYVATAQRAATTPPTPIFYLPLQGNLTNYGSNTIIPPSSISGTGNPQYLALANPVFNGKVSSTFNYISVANTITWSIGGNYTIACWVYVNNFGINNWIYTNQRDGAMSFAMFSLTYQIPTSTGTATTGSDGLVYYTSAYLQTGGNIRSNHIISTNKWTHIALTVKNGNIGNIYI
jgi:hypothetical protein